MFGVNLSTINFIVLSKYTTKKIELKLKSRVGFGKEVSQNSLSQNWKAGLLKTMKRMLTE